MPRRAAEDRRADGVSTRDESASSDDSDDRARDEPAGDASVEITAEDDETAPDTDDPAGDAATDDGPVTGATTPGRRHRARQPTRRPAPPTRHPDLAARCEILDPDPVPITVETARRLLCDSHVSRVLLRGRSEVPDLGRTTRLFTTAQRRAIVLRDGGCVAHGCDRGPRYCEIHHLRPWEHGGRTDLANGVLLCSRHHHLVHEGGWQVSARPDGTRCLTRAHQRPAG